MRIGVDVGGTNTDAVLMDGRRVVATTKATTTPDVTTGIVQAVRDVLHLSGTEPGDVGALMIGTTHFTNALVERRRLLEVGIVRIGAPATLSLLPMTGWPEELSLAVGRHAYVVPGGYDHDGREYAPFDEGAVRAAAQDIRRKGLAAVAISCVFSSVNSDFEQRAAAIVRELLPDVHLTLSSEIGRVGLLERENAAIMNASLADLARHVVVSMRRALHDLDVAAPLYVTQNDGTLMAAELVERHPVLTIASGPTNSMRGAAFLTGSEDAMVVDIGGTTSDVGALAQGFPRESSVAVDIGGVRTNFRMPDILAIGLGGGSLVRRLDGNGQRRSHAGVVTIGPDSVGYELTRRARVFGGDVLTLTDVAVAAGILDLGDRGRVADLEPGFAEACLHEMHVMLEEAVDRMKTSSNDVPVILVGGGAPFVTRPMQGASRVVIPREAGVANAIGAAIAQVSGEVDRVYSYDAIGREAALQDARRLACDRAREAGASANVRVLDVEEIPLAYVPGGAVRLRVKALGELPLDASGEAMP